MDVDTAKPDATATTVTIGSGGSGSGTAENVKVKNKEAILTAGMGYGRKKRQALAAFWSTAWPKLEKIGWRRVSS